ncbi:MAG: DUF3820 family protein [Spirochaetaceae bacterium]|nr:DUF3820 family protein [Spirochaetaceae bacterium]
MPGIKYEKDFNRLNVFMLCGGSLMDEHKELLLELANAKMPFGKYGGYYLIDLPESYVLWFRDKGFPSGRLGEMMENLLVIKENGLEKILRPLQTRRY